VEVFSALEKNNQNTGGAYIDQKPFAYFIRSEGLVESLKDIENIVIKENHTNGLPLLIRDVAKVRIGNANRYGAMTYGNQGEVVGGIVLMLKGSNSSLVISKVKERIAQIEKTLPEGWEISHSLTALSWSINAIGTGDKESRRRSVDCGICPCAFVRKLPRGPDRGLGNSPRLAVCYYHDDLVLVCPAT